MKEAVREAARTIQRMGTSIELKVAHTKPESVLDELETQLKGYDHRFSANDPRSELNQLNQLAGQKGLVLDPELYQLIEIGKHHSCAPHSQLNIAIGPLVQAWRIGFEDARIVSKTQVKELLALTDPQQIQLAAGKVFLKAMLHRYEVHSFPRVIYYINCYSLRKFYLHSKHNHQRMA